MTRDDLYKLRKEVGELGQLKESLAMLENMRISPRAAAYGGDRVQSSTKGDIQAENIQKIDDLKKRYNAKLGSVLERIGEFETLAEGLEESQREIMRDYFIQCKTWEEICVARNFSYRRVMQIRNDAMKTLFGDDPGRAEKNY